MKKTNVLPAVIVALLLGIVPAEAGGVGLIESVCRRLIAETGVVATSAAYTLSKTVLTFVGTDDIVLTTGGTTISCSDAGTTIDGDVLDVESEILIREQAAPNTPGTGQVAFYAKSDGLLYSKDDAGAEKPLHGYGPWTSYTGGGTWVDNTTYVGWYYRVDGSSMQIRGMVVTSGAPTATGLNVNLPSGYSFNATIITQTGGELTEPIGLSCQMDSGQRYLGLSYVHDSNEIVVVIPNVGGTYPTLAGVSNTVPFTFGTSDYVIVTAEFPYTGP